MTASFAIFLIALIWLAWETRWFRIRLPQSNINDPGILQFLERWQAYFVRQPDRSKLRRLHVCMLVAAPILVAVLLSPLILQYLFFRMPSPSPDFDCDDGTLLMFTRLSRLGISATPLLGNLKKTGEVVMESDHVWVTATIFGLNIAFDWGSQRFDSQHYEGYPITYEQLLELVEQDKVIPGIPSSY